MSEWIVAGVVFAAFVAVLPGLLAKARAGARRGGGGFVAALGLIFATAFDPGRAAAVEQIDRQRETGETEDEAPGAPPR